MQYQAGDPSRQNVATLSEPIRVPVGLNEFVLFEIMVSGKISVPSGM
jgi:hypothetical protein